MMITTKGRNALKVMLDLAQHDDGNPVSLTDIAERVRESQKYLESTVSQLSQKGLITSTRGKSGGYRLAKPVKADKVQRNHLRKRLQLSFASAMEGARRGHYELPHFQDACRFAEIISHFTKILQYALIPIDKIGITFYN